MRYSLPSTHKDVVKTLSERQAIGCIDVFSLLEVKVSSMSVDNVVVTLRSVAVLWQQLHFSKCFGIPWKAILMGTIDT